MAQRQIAKTVDGYIATFPKPQQLMMKQIRAAIKSTCPAAKEMISYAIPFYEYRAKGYAGRMIYFAGYAKHIGVYAVPHQLSPALAKQIAKYKAAKSTLQFPVGTKVPVTMIKQLVKVRMKEIDAGLKQKGS